MTTDTLTITAFLEQRIAEDEAYASSRVITTRGDSPVYYTGALMGSHGGGVIIHRSDGQREEVGSYQVFADYVASEHPEMIHVRDPRMLAECAAKRRIVADCEEVSIEAWDTDDVPAFARSTLRAIASIWSDHPDFDNSWSL